MEQCWAAEASGRPLLGNVQPQLETIMRRAAKENFASQDNNTAGKCDIYFWTLSDSDSKSFDAKRNQNYLINSDHVCANFNFMQFREF